MQDPKRPENRWMDALWLIFLVGLALLPPVFEIHKQLALLAIVVFQLMESWLIARLPRRGACYSILVKILLSTLLLEHTGGTGINSSYFPIYFLPVVSAAVYFGPVASLAWTTAASLAYLSLLIPTLQDFELTSEGETVLIIRVLFFYIAGALVNRFSIQTREQVQRLQVLSEQLEATNRQLRRAEADVRRAERLAALGQLSAGLAHEIRNPLGVIKGSAEMLNQKMAKSEPLVAELAGFIFTEVNRLNALVARFLDFARPSQLDLRPENISEILEHSLESAAGQFPAGKVKVERHYAADLPEILVDHQLCEQVFINLITNGFQAMGEQGGTLTLSTAPEKSVAGPGIMVTVEDSGPGVPPEMREQIFNPFFTSKKEGVGLGLSIVAKIVDDHRGWIHLDHDTTSGARFRVFFPLSAPA